MIHKFINILFVLVLAFLPLQILADGKKIALVIGNANYEENSHVRPLLCPLNDAKGIASKLKNLGYKLTFDKPILDGSRDEILDAIDQFTIDAEHADVVVFFYSGHAISYKGESYIMPIGQEFKKSSMVSRCISFKDIKLALEKSSSGAKIMFLDACRNNPLELGGKSSNEDENRGLSRDMNNIPRGTKICYATQPGKTADDGKTNYSPFTQAIIEFIDQKDEPLNVFLAKVQKRVEKLTGNQRPCFVGEITNGFCFNAKVNSKESLETAEENKDTLYCYFGEGDYKYTQGAFNKKGKIIHAPRYRQREWLYYSDGILAIQNITKISEGECFCYFENLDGNIVIPKSSKYTVGSSFSEGLCRVSYNNYGDKVDCFIGLDGNVKFKTGFYDCGDFHEGLARVCNNEKSDHGKWGFIDDRGNLVIDFIYANVSDFINGYAIVKIKNKYGFINHDNKLITKKMYKNVYPFSEGLAPFTNDYKTWGFIDCNGNEVILATYRYARRFSEGLAAVNVNFEDTSRRYGFINKKGDFVIEAQYNDAGDFHEGVATVMKFINEKRLYGYIDKKGTLQIPYQYEEAGDFWGGYAPVKKDGVRGVINTKGEFTPLHY